MRAFGRPVLSDEAQTDVNDQGLCSRAYISMTLALIGGVFVA